MTEFVDGAVSTLFPMHIGSREKGDDESPCEQSGVLRSDSSSGRDWSVVDILLQSGPVFSVLFI